MSQLTDEQKAAAVARFKAHCELAYVLSGRVSPDDAQQIARSVFAEYGLDYDAPAREGRADV